MHTLSQMNPTLHAEVLRRQEQVWTDLVAALDKAWTNWLARRWTPVTGVSSDEILADLAYGRD
ncbi:MAG: hypothetical protein WCE62_22115 [Polyangiales bacterium]